MRSAGDEEHTAELDGADADTGGADGIAGQGIG